MLLCLETGGLASLDWRLTLCELDLNPPSPPSPPTFPTSGGAVPSPDTETAATPPKVHLSRLRSSIRIA